MVRATHTAVKGLKVTQAEVAKGKAGVKAAILMTLESGGKEFAPSDHTTYRFLKDTIIDLTMYT